MRRLLFSLLLLFIGFNARAFDLAEFYYLTDSNEQMVPSRSISYLKEKGQRLGINDVLKLGKEKWSYEARAEVLTMKDPSVPYWIRVDLVGDALKNGEWMMEVLDSHVDSLAAYVVVDSVVRDLGTSGMKMLFGERTFKHKNFIYNVPSGTEHVTFYFRYTSVYRTAFIYKVWKDERLVEYATTEYYMLGGFYGILVLLAVYNLLLFFSAKERFYIFYVLFVISCIFVGMVEDRTGFQFIWPSMPFLNRIIDYISPLFFLVATVLFGSTFLRMDEKHKTGWRLLWVTVGLNLLYFFYGLFKGQLLWNSPYYILPFGVVFVYALMILRKGDMESRFFLVGYAFVMLGVSIISLRALGIYIIYHILGVYAFNFSLIMKVFFFSMALAERYRMLKEEKESAQQRIIQQLRDNEKIIEQKVVERTDKINKQKLIIESKNDELSEVNQQLEQQSLQLAKQADEIARMNELLKGENMQLQESVKEIATARVLMQDVNMDEFTRIFPNDQACFQYLEELKWDGETFECKKCGNDKYSKGTGPFARRCTKCGFNESTTNGTLFHRLHFPIQKAFYILFLVYAKKGDVTAAELSTELDVRHNTCWKFSKKVKERLGRLKDVKSTDKHGWSKLIID
ncbi:7TM diverse intracellular signaling domain-containing protein [Limibacter armeniacum]|uniref:7TM diverse intracellular signaling domain-containing protein n=1 Tax=Limibacter armeniacum TaxID=466084 RepID=UPI002FE5A284